MTDESSQRPLVNRGFISLVVTQFFGVVNDNLLKQVLTFGLAMGGVWKGALGDGGHSWVAVALVLPFLLFGAIAGQLADRYSKQLVTVRMKQLEFLIVLSAFAGFYFNNFWLCLLAMFLLGTQSAFFGPAKYGVIPELVGESKISMANALINMLTNVAAILSVVVGGKLYEAYRGAKGATAPEGMLWLPGLILLGVAVLGLLAALRMPKLEPAAEELEVKWEFFAPYRRTISNMLNAETPIFVVCLLKAGFFMTAYIVLLILADYTVVLGKPEAEVSFIVFGTVGVSIAVGSILSGFISRGGIQPRLIPVGTLGIMVCSLLLAWAPSSYVVIYRADAALAEQGLTALPADASVSFSQERARKRLLELKPNLDLQNDESSLVERLAKVKSGEVRAMVITAANLDAFPHETVKSRAPQDGNSTAEYHALFIVNEQGEPLDENGTVIKDGSGQGVRSGLVGMPVELRSRDYYRILIYLFFVGMSAGMYVIPLQALIQKLSPVDSRGQYIAASNAMDSVMNLCGIGSFFLLRNLGVQSQEIFFLTALLAMTTSTMFFWKIRQHINNPEWR